MDAENDQEYNCPYCGAPISARVDRSGGPRQTFVTDCEVCCRPIEVEISIEDDGYVNLVAKREGEG